MNQHDDQRLQQEIDYVISVIGLPREDAREIAMKHLGRTVPSLHRVRHHDRPAPTRSALSDFALRNPKSGVQPQRPWKQQQQPKALQVVDGKAMLNLGGANVAVKVAG